MSNQDVNVNTGNALGAIFQRRPQALPVQFLSPGAGAPRIRRFAQGYTRLNPPGRSAPNAFTVPKRRGKR